MKEVERGFFRAEMEYSERNEQRVVIDSTAAEDYGGHSAMQ